MTTKPPPITIAKVRLDGRGESRPLDTPASVAAGVDAATALGVMGVALGMSGSVLGVTVAGGATLGGSAPLKS